MARDYTGRQQSMGNYQKQSAIGNIASGINKAFSDYSFNTYQNARYLAQNPLTDKEKAGKFSQQSENGGDSGGGNTTSPRMPRAPRTRKPGMLSRDSETGEMLIDVNQDATLRDFGRLAGAGARVAGRGVVRGGAKVFRSIQGRIGKGAGQSQEFNSLDTSQTLDTDYRD